MPAGDGIKLNHVISGGVYLGNDTSYARWADFPARDRGPACVLLSRKSGSAAFSTVWPPRNVVPGRPSCLIYLASGHISRYMTAFWAWRRVFRLVKDLLGVGLKDLRRDLLPTVGGQAVLYHTPRVGEGHKAVVDLIAGKGGGPDGTLLLLAHGGPHVGKDHVGPGGRLLGGADQGEFEVRLAGGKCEHLGVRGRSRRGRPPIPPCRTSGRPR